MKEVYQIEVTKKEVKPATSQSLRLNAKKKKTHEQTT